MIDPPLRVGLVDRDLGRPELVRQIRALIAREGPITFARFMDLALYAPGLGYYATLRPGPEGESGALADYQTSPQLHPVFGHLLAAELLEVWRALGCPDPFVIVEPGAGAGELADQIRAGLRESQPNLTVVYHAVDRRTRADVEMPKRGGVGAGPGEGGPSRRPGEAESGPIWWSSLGDLQRAGITAHAIVSNEFFDALPVHRLARIGGELRESYVDWSARGPGFVERLGPLSDPRLADQLGERGRAEGWRGEVGAGRSATLGQLAALIERGVILSVDYGFGVADGRLGSPDGETLVAYHRHQWNDDLYRRVGLQDLTSHVDFAALLRIGTAFGLEPAGALTQRDFLLRHGLPEAIARWSAREKSPGARWQARLAMAELAHPSGLGSLKVVAQTKGDVSYRVTRDG